MERLKLRVAAYCFLIKEDTILLSRRFSTGWRDGDYSVPAGHLEEGEGVMDTLVREVQEETGVELRVEDVELAHVMHRKPVQYIDFFFVTRRWSGEPAIMEKDKCDDMRWFSLHDLPEHMVPSVRSAIEQYQKGIPFSDFLLEG